MNIPRRGAFPISQLTNRQPSTNQPPASDNQAVLASDSFQRIAPELNDAQTAYQGRLLLKLIQNGDLNKVKASLATIPENQVSKTLTSIIDGRGVSPLGFAAVHGSPAIFTAMLKAIPNSQRATDINKPADYDSNAHRYLTPIQFIQMIDARWQENERPRRLTNACLLLAHGADPTQLGPTFKRHVVAHSLGQIEEYSKEITKRDATPADVHFATHTLRGALDKVNRLPESKREQYYQPVREQFNQFLKDQTEKLEVERYKEGAEQPGTRQPTIALLERTRPLLQFQGHGIQFDSKKLDALGAAAVRANYLEFVPTLINAGATWQETGREIANQGKSA